MIQTCSALRSNNKQCRKLNAESSRKRGFSTKASLHDSDKRMIQRCAYVCSRRRFGNYSQADFMRCYGVCTSFSAFRLVKWITDALQERCIRIDSSEEPGEPGAEIHCSGFGNGRGRMVILDIFVENWSIDRDSVNVQRFVLPGRDACSA